MHATDITTLPLFPLQAVLFPGGLLSLKVFEARYLDLVSECLRENKPFGVVSLRVGSSETHKTGQMVEMESIGVMAQLIDVDSEQPNILQVRCRGLQRFETVSRKQLEDGLWIADTKPIAEDAAVLPTEPLIDTARSLANAINSLKQQGTEPFLKPFHFENAGWVANRWCEILPISLAAKQKLMELPDPLARLKLVNDYLRNKGVVT